MLFFSALQSTATSFSLYFFGVSHLPKENLFHGQSGEKTSDTF